MAMQQPYDDDEAENFNIHLVPELRRRILPSLFLCGNTMMVSI